eukprot:4786951-Pyramimonas_sp.AAC.1
MREQQVGKKPKTTTAEATPAEASEQDDDGNDVGSVLKKKKPSAFKSEDVRCGAAAGVSDAEERDCGATDCSEKGD